MMMVDDMPSTTNKAMTAVNSCLRYLFIAHLPR